MQKSAPRPENNEGAVALGFGTMRKAIVSTLFAGMVRAGGVLLTPHRSVFYSTAFQLMLQEKWRSDAVGALFCNRLQNTDIRTLPSKLAPKLGKKFMGLLLSCG